MNEKNKKYPVVTLCGSTRFKDEFMETQKRLTLEGYIVISVGLFGHSGDNEVWENMDEGTMTKTKEMLDDIHKRKIDMSDEIYVINVGDYIGDSTKSEIDYAIEHGKKVSFLEPHNDSSIVCKLFPDGILNMNRVKECVKRPIREEYGSKILIYENPSVIDLYSIGINYNGGYGAQSSITVTRECRDTRMKSFTIVAESRKIMTIDECLAILNVLLNIFSHCNVFVRKTTDGCHIVDAIMNSGRDVFARNIINNTTGTKMSICLSPEKYDYVLSEMYAYVHRLQFNKSIYITNNILEEISSLALINGRLKPIEHGSDASIISTFISAYGSFLQEE